MEVSAPSFFQYSAFVESLLLVIPFDSMADTIDAELFLQVRPKLQILAIK